MSVQTKHVYREFILTASNNNGTYMLDTQINTDDITNFKITVSSNATISPNALYQPLYVMFRDNNTCNINTCNPILALSYPTGNKTLPFTIDITSLDSVELQGLIDRFYYTWNINNQVIIDLNAEIYLLVEFDIPETTELPPEWNIVEEENGNGNGNGENGNQIVTSKPNLALLICLLIFIIIILIIANIIKYMGDNE